MIRFRTVESHVDLCSLPSPHRIPRSLAGNAGPIHFLGSGRNFRDGFPSA